MMGSPGQPGRFPAGPRAASGWFFDKTGDRGWNGGVPGSVFQPLPSARATRPATSPGTSTQPGLSPAASRAQESPGKRQDRQQDRRQDRQQDRQNDGRHDWRDHFGVWVALGGAAFLGYALAAPVLSPASVTPLLRAGLEPGISALWLALARGAAGFPLGDPLAHVRAISIASAAAAVALLLWRTAHATTDIGGRAPGVLHPTEIIGGLAAALTVALSRSLLTAATVAGPVAVGALLALATLVLAERVGRAPSDRRAGLGLAVIAGALAGGPLAAAALGWPLATLVGLRAMRRRQRWPALGPALVAIAALIAVVRLATGSAPLELGALAGRLFLVPVVRAVARVSGAGVARAAAELADQVGVIGLLVAAVGLPRLRWRALVFTVWPLGGGLILRAAFGGGAEGTIGIIVAVSAVALPLAVGMVRLAQRLGRAEVPAVAAIGVMVALWPLLAK